METINSPCRLTQINGEDGGKGSRSIACICSPGPWGLERGDVIRIAGIYEEVCAAADRGCHTNQLGFDNFRLPGSNPVFSDVLF